MGIFLSAYLLPRLVQLAGAAVCALIWVVYLRRWRRQRVDKRLRPVLYTAGLSIALLWSWGYDMRTVYPAEQLVNLLVFILKRFYLCEKVSIYGELWI